MTTLAFSHALAAPAHAVGGHLEDVNEDGYTDLVSHFRGEETGIAVGDTIACLTFETTNGALVSVASSIVVCNDIETEF